MSSQNVECITKPVRVSIVFSGYFIVKKIKKQMLDVLMMVKTC